jgi:kynurenine formamidase
MGRIIMKIDQAITRYLLLAVIFGMSLSFKVAAESPGFLPETGQLLDMTYPFDANTIYWPTAEQFKLEKLSWQIVEGGWWYASNNYGASEHGGTHVDAPIHFAENGKTIDQIPLSDWIGPAVKIDVVAKCLADRNYRLTVDDINQWEAKYGRIPDNAWVLMYTGIDTRYYPDREKVLGTKKSGPAALEELSFPGFSAEVARFLTQERNIRGIGLDTPSIDYGKSKDFPVHRICFSAGKLAIENIAALDKLPPAGAMLYAMPMLIKDGTGAPARIFALLPATATGVGQEK